MARTFIRVIRLGKWFPPGDKLAAAIARLIILREDLMLELRGIKAPKLPELDEHSEQWRRLFFFRSSIRTLWEIQGTLTTIRMNPEFKRILKKQSIQEQNDLSRICAKLNAAASLMKDLRNALGGHVLQEKVAEAIDNLADDRWGVLEVGSAIKGTHFKMAGDLVAEMFVAGVHETEKAAKTESDLKTLAELLPVVERLENVLVMYTDARGLI